MCPEMCPEVPLFCPEKLVGTVAERAEREQQKTPKPYRLRGFRLVDDTRLELVTSRTSSGCSYQLS